MRWGGRMLRYWPWAVLLALCASAVPVSPQSSCDPNLRSKVDDPYGYRQRSDRCEGVYVQEVSAALWVASFTREPSQLPPQPPSLRLNWSARDAEVHLQANALRPRVHYRMDAARPHSGHCALSRPFSVYVFAPTGTRSSGTRPLHSRSRTHCCRSRRSGCFSAGTES